MIVGIASQRWPAGTVHLNGALALNREHQPGASLGVIVEGPYEWQVRPVMELFAEQASGSPRTVSRLIGAIWRSKEHLSPSTSGSARQTRATITFVKYAWA